MYGDTEERGDVSPNTTDHETTTTAAATPAVKNNIPPPVCDQETAEQASRAVLQEDARARSGERNEQASSSTEQEFNEVSAEDLGHLQRRIRSDEGAHIMRIDRGLYDQGIRQGGSTNDTDQGVATTATAREEIRSDTRLQARSTERVDLYATEREGIYTTYGHLALPPADDVLPCCTGYQGHYNNNNYNWWRFGYAASCCAGKLLTGNIGSLCALRAAATKSAPRSLRTYTPYSNIKYWAVLLCCY
jgi:hypothetical protein